METEIIHLINANDATTTLCGKSAEFPYTCNWTFIESEVTCTECLKLMEIGGYNES